MTTIKNKIERLANRITGGDQEVKIIIDDTCNATNPAELEAMEKELQEKKDEAKANGKDVIIITIVK